MAGLVAWPTEHGETDAHHGISSLRFPCTPLPQTGYTALENTARDGDSIDNTGSIDLLVGWERTRWKVLQHSHAGGYELLSLYSHSNDEGYYCCSWLALGWGSTDVYTYQGALLPVELAQRHPRGILCSSSGWAASPQLTLTLGQPKAFRQHFARGGHSLSIVSR